MLDEPAQLFLGQILTQAKYKGVGPHRPVTIDKVVGDRTYMVLVSHDIPSHLGCPLGLIWINPDSTSNKYGRLFKLSGVSSHSISTEGTPVDLGDNQLWLELSNGSDIFTYKQVYWKERIEAVSTLPGIPGKVGPDGNQGLIGDQGPLGDRWLPGDSVPLDTAVVARGVVNTLARLFVGLQRLSGDLAVFYGVGPDMREASDSDLYSFMKFMRKISTDMSSKHTSFSIDQGSDEYGYFILPTRFLASADLNLLFQDDATNLCGGWDGMMLDPMTQVGARKFIHFYPYDNSNLEFSIFRTDWPSLGKSSWRVRIFNT